MPIIIPSKHIYSKSFDPVIDNNIDKVEVNSNKVNVQIDKDNLSYTETVFTQLSEGQVIGQTTYTTESKDFSTKNAQIVEGLATYNVSFHLLTYSEMKLGFLSIPIKIYANSYQDKYITDLYDGKDENGNDKIEYTSEYMSVQLSASGDWHYGDTQNKYPSNYDVVTYTYSTDNPIIAYKTGKIINDTLTGSPQNQVTLSNGIIKYHFEMSQTFKPQNATANVTLNISNEVSLADQTNVSTASFTMGTDKNGKYFAITLNVLVSRIITTLINDDFSTVYVYPRDIPNPRPMSGSQYRDSATQLSFTFHGETRFLNVAELIEYIGDKNGKRVFSVDNNELLQTTNTYNGVNAIQNNFTKTIESYKNGKQTATISCPIADYYDENSNKVIDITQRGKMLFSEGDIVIPYQYTNQGDKPLSYNKDFSPKQFKVVGTKISKEQGGMQVLTLQEV